MVLIRAQTAITFRQTAVTAYFRSTQLLLFAFAWQRIGGEKLLWCVNRHCNKIRYSVLLHTRNVKIIWICDAFTCQGQKSTFNNTKFDIFEGRYLSQDLISLLHNTPLDVSCGREGGWGLPRLWATCISHSGVTWSQPHSKHGTLTQC